LCLCVPVNSFNNTIIYLCIINTVCYWPDHQPPSVNTLSPCLLMLDCIHILVRTTHYGTHLTYVHALPLSYIGTTHFGNRRHFNDGVNILLVSIESFVTSGWRFVGARLVPMQPIADYGYFMLWPCVLGIRQLVCCCLCRLLTGYSKLTDFWSNDLPSKSEVFLNVPLLWVSWDGNTSRCVYRT
jgi:hypothetical protein